MEEIDISNLDKQVQDFILRFCELSKENTYLKNVIKDLTKLI